MGGILRRTSLRRERKHRLRAKTYRAIVVWRRLHLGRPAIVIATPGLWDPGEAIQGNEGRPC